MYCLDWFYFQFGGLGYLTEQTKYFKKNVKTTSIFAFFVYFLLYNIGFRKSRCCIMYFNIDFFITMLMLILLTLVISTSIQTDVECPKQPMLNAFFLVVKMNTNWRTRTRKIEKKDWPIQLVVIAPQLIQ